MNKQTCGCCEGIEKLTPQNIVNRPGLNELAYRVGTHATFLETMLARLSDLFLEITESSGGNNKKSLYPLRGLKTRDRNDAAIAWLDSWAIVADVLTFYQERIANEGFLNTAIERRSVLELARLVGYKLRPGVAATVYLAFELEKNQNIEIPKGVRAQSIPGSGEMPQAFETSASLEARFVWNAIKPRLTRPQWIHFFNSKFIDTFYFKGISTNLKPNDLLLLVFLVYNYDTKKWEQKKVIHFIHAVKEQADQNRTKVTTRWSMKDISSALIIEIIEHFFLLPPYIDFKQLSFDKEQVVKLLEKLKKKLMSSPLDKKMLNQVLSDLKEQLAKVQNDLLKSWIENIMVTLYKIWLRISIEVIAASAFGKLINLIEPLSKPPSLQPINPYRRPVSVGRSFSDLSDIGPQLLVAQNPSFKEVLYNAWRNTTVPPTSELVDLVTFRVKAAPFGQNAPLQAIVPRPGNPVTYKEWTFEDSDFPTPDPLVLNLDNQYKEIKAESRIVVEHAQHLNERKTLLVKSVQTISISGFGLSGKVTQLTVDENWYDNSWLETITEGRPPYETTKHSISLLRQITVYAQSEPLELAKEPIEDLVEGDSVELNGLYDGLKSGRWLVISGERVDLKVRASELVMLTAVTQDVNPNLPGDTPHTTLHFANSLAYSYKRDTVTINANVAHATQGETRAQILGSGDSSKALQEFKLSFSPLTYIPAITPSGIESTLEVRVNNILWRESENISELEPTDRNYITRQDNKGNTFVIFGNGEHGTRLPTGVENVKAVYRSGMGKASNVAAEQISLLVTRPLGVKGVLNLQPAAGGADPESANSGRQNATVALKSLGRAVSIQDYADFARAFAGIDKASAKRLSDGLRDLVHLTIAGADDILISKNSDLYRNLQQALFRFGDPHQALQIDMRELLLIVISAKVKILPEFLWESVEPRVRAAVLETFGFHNRELGQDVFRSELISSIEAVEGVDYVDVDKFDALSRDVILKNLSQLNKTEVIEERDHIDVKLAHIDLTVADPESRIRPAELAYLTPEVPDTLILTELS